MKPVNRTEALTLARRIKARFFRGNSDIYALDIYYQLCNKYGM